MTLSPSIEKLTIINTDLDQIFKEHMITYVLAQKREGISEKAACRFWLDYLKLTETEYQLDRAYKYCQRYFKSRPIIPKDGLIG